MDRETLEARLEELQQLEANLAQSLQQLAAAREESAQRLFATRGAIGELQQLLAQMEIDESDGP